jgi:hypothetical protein
MDLPTASNAQVPTTRESTAAVTIHLPSPVRWESHTTSEGSTAMRAATDCSKVDPPLDRLISTAFA